MSRDSALFKIVTRLVVAEFQCDADLITDTLGVQPTATWKAGEPVIPDALNVHHENGWVKDSPVDVFHTTPEESVTALLATFPDLAVFARLPRGCKTELAVVLYGPKERPYFSLSSQNVRLLADLSADIDVDIYDLSNTEDDTIEG